MESWKSLLKGSDPRASEIATDDHIFVSSLSLSHFETLLSYPQYAIEKGVLDFFKNEKNLKNVTKMGLVDCVRNYAEETNIFDDFKPWSFPN